MTQAKKSAAAPSAKLASNVANKTAKHTLAAVESSRAQAENVVKIGGNAVKEFLATGAGEAKKAQEKAFDMGREGAAQLAKSADAVTKLMYEAISASRDNVETAIECGNMAASMAKDVSAELSEAANKAFAEGLEVSKEAMSCRTINDAIELQNRVVRSIVDNFFNQSVKLSGMVFEYTTEALEPINERVAAASEQFSKALAA
ncbi:MAG: phasin family protein [Alphaproteobacteria bacterium]|nr:phasin family protein [Alphaproteobacteria bacterium]